MPGSAAKLLDSLGQDRKERCFAWLGESGRLKPGVRLSRAHRHVSALSGRGREGSGKPQNHKKADARRSPLPSRFPDFADELEAVWPRQGRRRRHIVTISTRLRRLADLLAIAEAHDKVFCSVGTHPHYAHEELDVTVEEIVRLSPHPKVVAIGEAGLDYFYDKSPRDGAGPGLPPPHSGGARDAVAARDPRPRCGRRRCRDPGGGDGKGDIPGGAALLYRRGRAGAARRSTSAFTSRSRAS